MTTRRLISLITLFSVVTLLLTPGSATCGTNNLATRYVKPNPFTEGTTFELTMPEEGRVRIVVYNVLGQLIKTLRFDEVYDKGLFYIDWDGKDEFDKPVPPGIYVCVLYVKDAAVSSVKAIKA